MIHISMHGTASVLDELAEGVSGTESVEDEVARKQLVEEINAFINTSLAFVDGCVLLQKFV